MRTTTVVLILATFAVLVRSFIYLRFEQLAFDSDQAITGLMAKHLIDGRAFPLFFYGQTYMLAVEAWAAAPLFLIAGPTVAALRASLLMWNVAFACLLILTLHRHNGLSPWQAFVPAVIFALAPPAVALQLMNAQGGIVEPYVYVVWLWLLRRRPLWFGALLAIGFRNREFVAYAVPALLGVELLSDELDRKRVGEWLAAAVAFAAGWQVIEALKPFADLMGPGTRGQLLGGFSGSQITNLIDRFDFALSAIPARLVTPGLQILQWFSGANQFNSGLPVENRAWIAVLAAIYLALVAGRLALLLLTPGGRPLGASRRARFAARVGRVDFPLYLTAVGAIAIVVFVAGKPSLVGYARYALLGLICPIGLIAAFLVLEPITSLRRLAAGLVIMWGLLEAWDHVSIAASYIRHPDSNTNRAVAERLVADGVRTAAAGYWRAYVITFLARERVRVASQDFVRIQEYQDEFPTNPDRAVIISEQPCPAGTPVGVLYLCKP